MIVISEGTFGPDPVGVDPPGPEMLPKAGQGPLGALAAGGGVGGKESTSAFSGLELWMNFSEALFKL